MNSKEIRSGIPHIEDLPTLKFLEILENLEDYDVSEKVDGSQILFGVDRNGFYTSRETRGGIRIYNEQDYGIHFASTYMRSAHRVLESCLPELKKAGLKENTQVEAEVLYGPVPNVVPYSEDYNYLIFLRCTEGDIDVRKLTKALKEKKYSVTLTIPFTQDGKEITLKEESNNWIVVGNPCSKVNLNFDIKREIFILKDFLSIQDPYTQKTNQEILETPLNKSPSWVKRGEWKTVKNYLKEVKENLDKKTLNYKLLVKEKLLDNLVRNRASFYGPVLEDGGWIEGVVLANRKTGKMVKIIDKEVFLETKNQAWAVREKLSERPKSVVDNSGFMGSLYLNLASSIGHQVLGTTQGRAYLKRLEESIQIKKIPTVKDYWCSAIEQKLELLEMELDKYRNTTKHPEHIRKRTLEVFASTFVKLREMKEEASKAKTLKDFSEILVRPNN